MVAAHVTRILLFLSVVDAGSFVAGGRAFGLSRSAAGKSLARLEEHYGARLLNRTTRAIALTQEGRWLYEHGKAIRAAIEAADLAMTGESSEPSGTLRITAPDALGRRLVLPVVRRFLERWPEMRIEMTVSDRVDRIVEDGYDLAIRVGMTSPDPGLVVRTIATDEPVLVAAPSYLHDRARPESIEQLSLHDLLQFSDSGARQGWYLRDEGGAFVRAGGRVRLRLDSGAALRDCALAGMGIALLPRLLVGADLQAGRLEQVLPDVDCGRVPIVALYPHRRLLEPRVRRFVDLLAEQAP
ncbi:MAG: LysR family transcriptional regulator [Salinarimonas sp.]